MSQCGCDCYCLIMSGLGSWDIVEQEVARAVAASSEAFDPATIRNAPQFLDACRKKCSIPAEIAKGFWNAICVSWDGVQVEIFDDRFEFYRFGEGATSIEYFQHPDGAEVPDELLDRLPCRKIEG